LLVSSGIDDARNIASIVRKLASKGFVLEPTSGTSRPNHRHQSNNTNNDSKSRTVPGTAPTLPSVPASPKPKTTPQPKQQQQQQPSKKNQKQPPPPPPDCGPIIDIGANLAHKPFNKDTLPEFLKKARKEAGVRHIIITGTSVKGSKEAIEICRDFNAAPNAKEDYPFLTCTVGKASCVLNIFRVGIVYQITLLLLLFPFDSGVHPHDSGHALKTESNFTSTLEKLITENRDIVVAVGECGLDFDRNFSTPEDQILAFEKQAELSLKLDMPLFLHERSAHEKFVEIFDKINGMGKGRLKGVLHCYTGETMDHLTKCLDLGLYVGITGWVTDTRPGRGTGLAQIVSKIPLDRLMVETDAPFLIPRNIKPLPKNNEPALLGHVVVGVAECYGMDPKEIGRVSTKNAIEFFGLPKLDISI
jgi:TatD DNase family protein